MKSAMKVFAPEFKKLLQHPGPFGHLAHPNPDGDGLGSAMAMHLFLKQKGKKTAVYVPDALPKYVQDLPQVREILQRSPKVQDAKVFFTYDSGDGKRLEEPYGKVLAQAEEIVNIDHHITNDNFGTFNFIDTQAAATGEIVYQLIQSSQGTIDKNIATWLYLSLMTDTGSFRYSNTTPQTFRIAADLVERGAEPHTLYRKVYEELTFDKLHFNQAVLKRLQREKEGRLVYADIPQSLFRKYQQDKEDAQDILDSMRSLEKCDVVVLFKEQKNRVKISFRSERSDVASIARQWGGGGHKRAAGAEVPGRLGEVKEKVLASVRKALQ